MTERSPDTAATSSTGATPAGVMEAPVLFGGPGEMRARCRAFDWAATPLGAVETWPQSLRTAAATALGCGFPTVLLWGPDLVQIYNDAFTPLLGVKHPAGLGQPTRACWPEVWHINAPIYARVQAGETVTCENAHYPVQRGGPDGPAEDLYLTISYSPVPDETGAVSGVLVTLLDTTAQVAGRADQGNGRLVAELSGERTLLRTVLDQMPTAVLVVEAPSGRVLALNDAVARVWGGPRPFTDAVDHYSEEWVGYHLDGSRIASEEWPIARAALAGETITDWVGEIERPDGTRATIEVSAAPVRDEAGRTVAAVGVVADVTARVLAARERERLLHELEVERARLADVFRQAPTFLAVMRGPTHVFELVNTAYYDLVGRRDLVGRPIDEALPEIRGQGFLDLLDRVLTTGEPFVGREVPVALARTPGGAREPRFVDFIYLPVVDADGTRSGVIAHGSDVTEQVEARREIERLLAESERARQDAEAAWAEAQAANRSKGEFLAVMSHELRTPLNAIGGYAELIELGIRGPVTPQQREDLARIQKSQRHLLGLINGVLNYSRAEAGAVHYELSDVPLDVVLATCETLIAPQARAKGIALHLAACREPLTARADREKLQQILVNLLSNAIKFTAAGGAVTLACASDGRPGREGQVVVTVRDTGRGIAAEALERVFEPFVQVDTRLTRTEEGMGLGLAISRDLARGMGGDLTAESTPGVGSTFTLTLPAP